MDIKLRNYQFRVLNQIWDCLQNQCNILGTAPCSAGKTILFSMIIERLLRENPGFRALTLVDREILVSQSRDKLVMVAPQLADHIGIVCASVSKKRRLDAPVTVASRQSLINCMDDFPPVHLVIVDECHLMAMPHADNMVPDQWATIIAKLREYNPYTRLLGFTASPYRLGSKGGYIYGKRNREDAHPYFDQVDAEITTRELLDGGYITPLTGFSRVSGDYKNDIAQINMVAGEFNLGQLTDMMCKPVHVQSCVDAWEEHIKNQRHKTLIFCTSIEHAEVVAQAFNAHGVSSCAIHSKLSPVEEKARMEALVQGTMQVFTSVAKLTTGMDVADIDAIIMARPTESASLYQQCVGRGQRLADGKTDCLVIDLVGCTQKFGTDMDNLIVSVPRTAGSGEAPKKICQGEHEDGTVCGASVHASLAYCPECGFKFPMTEEVEAAMGTLKEVKFNEIPDPEEWECTSVYYDIHTSRADKQLIKVTYQCGMGDTFREWVCLPDHYSGYAVDKAVLWWERRTAEPFPQSVDEFMFLADELMEPAIVVTQKKGKYDEVKEVIFNDEMNGIDHFTDDFPAFENKTEMPTGSYDPADIPF